ncbi:MAG: Fic family protein [Candidatus Omnitrophica bacterium]|nr:Fic family protein [Candidatus Omnitrophota bacterium]
MPFNPKFTITTKINKPLVEIERVRGFLDAIKIKEEWFSTIQKEALILETHYSTHIEGTALTLEQARKILSGKDVKGIRPDDRKELLNYKKAMDFVSTYLGKEDPITEGLIREIHKTLVRGARGGEALPGEYRKVQNYVVNSRTKEIIYTPPPPLEVPHLMRGFTQWLNEDKDISDILIAGITQFQFVHIHPFLDGNGRTARLLSTLILYKTGYDFKRLFTLSEYYDKDRLAYYKAIQSVRENNMDMTFWLEYFIEGLRIQMSHIREKSKRIIKYDSVLQKAETIGLKERQINVLKFIIQNQSISRSQYVERFKASLRTANYDLSLLESRGLIKRIGVGRAIKYILK